MGEMADMMLNGTMCHQCGVYLEPSEIVYLVNYESKKKRIVIMPKNGEPFGLPVHCSDCKGN